MPDMQKLKELVQRIEVAMMTTTDSEGHLRSRPMATLQVEGEDCLWFFTGKDSPKASELEKDPRINLSYGDPQKDCFVSVSGRGALVKDRAKIQELWFPEAKIWFPKGIDDPELSLLRVDVEQAEYWNIKNGKRTGNTEEDHPSNWDHGKIENPEVPHSHPPESQKRAG